MDDVEVDVALAQTGSDSDKIAFVSSAQNDGMSARLGWTSFTSSVTNLTGSKSGRQIITDDDVMVLSLRGLARNGLRVKLGSWCS